MKVSLNVIKQYLGIELPPVDELVERINMQLGGVEAVTDLASKYKDVVIVKVVECEKHPNADKLSVCMVDDSGVVHDVERDERGFVRVVCGAPNVHAGMFAAWLPPKSVVPATYNDKEPFVLSARELRGVVSNGMLAAEDELDLGSDHEGIIEITEEDLKKQESGDKTQGLKPGASFSELFALDDSIIDIENKMFTHRPDCFGQLGVAREIAGILGHKFTSPEWYLEQRQESRDKRQEGEELPLDVFNDALENCPRFMAVALKNVTVKPSPLWLQIELVRLGSKAINNIVDVTNYAMLLTGQPTHAYDYDKLRGGKLGVRMAHAGEQATFLNSKTYELTPDDIVIVDGEGVVGLGGVIGGNNSEVSADTTNIVLECAAFDMYAVRKTSMRHGIFTDAVTRFSKGQSSLQQPTILAYLQELIINFAGGHQASEVFDSQRQETRDKRQEIMIAGNFINTRLGLQLDIHDMKELLENVEFDIVLSHDSCLMTLSSPFWRTDIELPEDVVEEVGRLYGFDALPRELPKRSITPATKNPQFELKQQIRNILSRAGANEVLTYSFVHANTLKKAGQDPEKAFRLSNALSPDLQYYRLSLTPSLLEKVHPNSKAGHDEFALFEIGKAHVKGMSGPEGLPLEMPRVAAVYTSKKPKQGDVYYEANRLLSYLLEQLHVEDVRFVPLSNEDTTVGSAYYEPNRSAAVYCGDQKIGCVGEYKETVCRSFKLPEYTAGFEISLDKISSLQS